MVVVGRRRELDALNAGLQQALAGRGSVVLLEGHYGLGKSHLIRQVAEAAAAFGMPAFVGAAEELERGQPWAAFAAALRSGPDPAGAVSAFRAALDNSTPTEHDGPVLFPSAAGAGWQLVEMAVSLLEEQTHGGALIAVDDAQWADPLSLSALLAIARRAAHLPILLVVAFRPTPASPEMHRFVEVATQDTGGHHLMLHPMGEAEVAELAEAALGAPPGRAVLARLMQAGGNPFLVLELLTALTERGSRESGWAPRRREDLPDELPADVRRVILRRLRDVGPHATAVLRTAAVLTVFDVVQLAAVIEQPEAALIEPLQQAIEAGLLVDHGDSLAFRHDLVRQALYQDISPVLRSSLHLSAGRALARAGAPVAVVAQHLSLGARRGDSEAATWLHRAATEVSSRAPSVAAGLLQRALDILGTDPAGAGLRDAIRADLVEVLGWAGRTVDAERLALEALEGGYDEATGRSLRWGLALARFLKGDAAGAAAELETIAQTPALPAAERSRVVAELALARLSAADLSEARAAAESGLTQSPGDGDSVGGVVARTVLAMLTGFTGASRAAVELSAEAVTLADDDLRENRGSRAHRYHPLFFHGLLLTDADEFGRADEVLGRGRHLSEELGTTWAASLYHGAVATRSYRAGAWDDALAEAEAGLSFFEETGSRVAALWPRALLAMICVQRGQLDKALGHVRSAHGLGAGGLQFGSDLLLLAETLQQEARGERSAALAMLAFGWDFVLDIGQPIICATFGPPLVRLALTAGERLRAEDAVAVLEELAAAEDRASLVGTALRCRGLVEQDADVLLAAVDAYRRSPRRMELAEGLEDAGRVLHGGRRLKPVGAARDLLDEALSIYRNAGARPAVARVERLLGRPARAARPSTGWKALTPTERSIVDLVVEGYTNAQIAEHLVVSRRTVESHLYHVFSKVGVSSRLKLVVEVGRRASEQQSSEHQ
jgi:DNA-binding CsgD family transcriptional regulator